MAKHGKILVVDDEESILELCTRVLSIEGYEVVRAAHYKEAMAQLDATKFDLVLTDVKMPGKSGLDLIRELRSTRPEIPTVIMTGHGTMDTAMESLKLGVGGFVVKPFTSEELTAAVRNVIPQ